MASADFWLRPKLGISRGPGGTVRIDAVVRTKDIQKARTQLLAAARGDLAENIERAILFVPGVNKAAAVDKRIRVRRIDVQEPTQTCVGVGAPSGYAGDPCWPEQDEGISRNERNLDLETEPDINSDDDCKFVTPWQGDGGDGDISGMPPPYKGAGLSAENFARALGEGGSRALAQQEGRQQKDAESKRARLLREKQVAQAAEAGKKLGKALAQIQRGDSIFPSSNVLSPEAAEVRRQMLSSLCENACQALGAQLYPEEAGSQLEDSRTQAIEQAIDQRLWSEVGKSVVSEMEDLTQMGIFIPTSDDPGREESLWAEVGKSLAGQLGARMGPLRARMEGMPSTPSDETTQQMTVLSSRSTERSYEQVDSPTRSKQNPAGMNLKDRPGMTTPKSQEQVQGVEARGKSMRDVVNLNSAASKMFNRKQTAEAEEIEQQVQEIEQQVQGVRGKSMRDVVKVNSAASKMFNRKQSAEAKEIEQKVQGVRGKSMRDVVKVNSAASKMFNRKQSVEAEEIVSSPVEIYVPPEARGDDPVFWAEVGRRFARQSGTSEEEIQQHDQAFWAKVGMEIAAKAGLPT